MKTPNRTGIALVATLLLSVTALASERPPDQHHDASFSAGQPGDATDGVGVDHEVLTEGPAGPQPVLVEDLPDLSA